MAWPKGKPRKKQLLTIQMAAVTESVDFDARAISLTIPMPKRMESFVPETTYEAIAELTPEEVAQAQYPADWHPGMLLNVRNTGPDYTITLWPEEADPRKPERALHFTNPGECQNFVSKWYARQSHDPRAR